jgi:hypothetical protein
MRATSRVVSARGGWPVRGRQQQVLAGRRRPGLDPGGDRARPRRAARRGCDRACRGGRSPTSWSSTRSPGAAGDRRSGGARRRRRRRGGGLGAAQPGGAEQVQQRELALAVAGAAVGYPQQPRVLVVGEGARLPARDPRRTDGSHGLVGADRVGEPSHVRRPARPGTSQNKPTRGRAQRCSPEGRVSSSRCSMIWRATSARRMLRWRAARWMR